MVGIKSIEIGQEIWTLASYRRRETAYFASGNIQTGRITLTNDMKKVKVWPKERAKMWAETFGLTPVCLGLKA